MDVHLQSEAIGFRASVFEHSEPGRAAENGWSFGRALVHVHDHDPPNAGALHRFEISGDAVAGNIPVKPKPKNPGASRGRRTDKALLEAGNALGGVK